MSKKTWQYVFFVHKLIIKKKNTIIIPFVWLMISIILSVIISLFNINNNTKLIAFFAVIFGEMLLTILYSSLKTLNIYKDFEEEGIELLTLSKAISRKDIFIGRFITNFFSSFLFAFILMISNIIIAAGLKSTPTIYLSFVSLPIFILAYLIFGYISSLIAYKANAKLAITVPFVIFTPLSISGVVIAARSTSISNNLAFYLNAPFKNHPSGNIANVEKFYLNDNKDNYYILPNGFDKNLLSDEQIKYINKAYDYSKNSATGWQVFSYFSLPYQFVDYFNYKNLNIFNTFSSSDINNLNDILYYDKLDSYSYNYSLSKPSLKLYDIGNQQKAYLVAGSLKANSFIPNLVNSNIIYARENADKFNVFFPEDKLVHSASDDLVGELKWTYIKELLQNKYFKFYANEFFTKFLKKIDGLKNLVEIKSIFNRDLEDKILNNDKHMIYSTNDLNSFILNLISLGNKDIVKTLNEKKIYIATAFIYYAYFTYNNTPLADAILFNGNDFSPKTYSLKIGDFNYNIGGYSSYVAKQQVINNNVTGDDNSAKLKISIRYDLNPSSNFLFQPVNNLIELKRSNIPVVEKNIYFLIWILVSLILISTNSFLYYRKDYK